MLPGSRGLFARSGDLFRKVGGRINFLSILDIEVGKKDHLKTISDLRVPVYHFGHGIN